METIFGLTGVLVVTTKTLYWASLLGYIVIATFCVVAAYTLPQTENLSGGGCKDEVSKIDSLVQWVLATNMVAFASIVGFYYFTKGETVSVVSGIAWLLNFVNSLIVFIYAQVTIYDDSIVACKSLAAETNSTYVRSYDAALTHVIVQYVKLAIIIVGPLYYKCCVKGAKRTDDNSFRKSMPPR